MAKSQLSQPIVNHNPTQHNIIKVGVDMKQSTTLSTEKITTTATIATTTKEITTTKITISEKLLTKLQNE